MGSYTVKKGDSLWKIAKSQLGTKSNADTAAAVQKIWKANKSKVSGTSGVIKPGAKLTLPGGSGGPTSTGGSTRSASTPAPARSHSGTAGVGIPGGTIGSSGGYGNYKKIPKGKSAGGRTRY